MGRLPRRQVRLLSTKAQAADAGDRVPARAFVARYPSGFARKRAPPRAAESPHVHVKREKMVAKFWLNPVVLQKAGGFSRTELNRIATLVIENQALLLERWYEFFGH